MYIKVHFCLDELQLRFRSGLKHKCGSDPDANGLANEMVNLHIN